MKRIVFVLILALIPATAHAMTLMDVLTFSTPVSVIDTQSGNQVNYAYFHDFEELTTSGLNLLSGTFSLTHLGNSNTLPTGEVWSVLTGNGTLIGNLSASESKKVTDSWILSQDVLNEITAEALWKLKIGLSELTSFNNEKLDLYRTELKINYEERPKTTIEIPINTPATPEPSGFILFLTGISLAALRRAAVGQS